jgi:predicted O-methyltransferase YrrM
MIVTEAVEAYLNQARRDPDPVLAELEARGREESIPIVVPVTGAALHALALASGARRVVEVGTAIGVSTLHLARAVGEGGRVVSFDIDADRQAVARDALSRAGVVDRVDLRLVDAREGLRELEGEFDLAFVDGVKEQYSDYLDAILPLMRVGGLVLADNVLMSGTVAENESDGHWRADQIAAMRAFNQRLVDDERLATVITPIGDGIAIAVRVDG